jgi:NADH:ubiquinone oxidoreductase subunit
MRGKEQFKIVINIRFSRLHWIFMVSDSEKETMKETKKKTKPNQTNQTNKKNPRTLRDRAGERQEREGENDKK